MKVSQYLLATRRETPNDAEIISHQLMFRAGMVRKVASGLYVEFENKQSAITEGQFVAWYLEDELVGSGVIS